MDQDPKNYRDPKVTTDTTRRTTTTGSSSMSWLWIAVAVVVGLLLLAWLFGWMGTSRTATVPATDGVVIENTAPAPGTATAPDTTIAPAPGAPPEGTAGDQAIPGGTTVPGGTDTTGGTVDITPEAEAPEVEGEVETQTVPIQPAD
jgi:hypothetical protein